jgi:hypothetical protein
MISSTVGIDTGSEGDFQVLRVPPINGDTSSEHSACSDKSKFPNFYKMPLVFAANELPQSAPPLSSNESLFVFERRKSLIQELPAISEDQLVDEKGVSSILNCINTFNCSGYMAQCSRQHNRV